MQTTVQELQDTMARLDSIDAVRIVVEGDDIKEIHVLASPAKAPKQIVRDVQSLAMAKYGTNIDRRVISVVQIAPDDLPRPESNRPALVGIQEVPDGSRVTVSVELEWMGNRHVGSAMGPAVTSARYRLIGEATLHALEDLTEEAAPLALDTVGPTVVGMREVIIAIVVSANGLEEEIGVGSALAGDDSSEGTVRAVLDAMNRRLARATH